MLRDQSLIPLSRQHQHALALCVRLEQALRAGTVDLEAWQQEIERHFAEEIQFHFAAEEAVLFPAAGRFPELVALVEELSEEHRRLRAYFARASENALHGDELSEFARLLSGHIRKEERQLFEAMPKLVSVEEMKALGKELLRSLEAAAQACRITPTDKTGD